MKRRTLLFVLTCGYLTVAAQAPNNLGFPSESNSFLGSIGSSSTATGIGVDLYTGTARINIPICNLGSKELSIPVSLNYVAGRGVKLQNFATPVGLGWQLNAGGNISRVVRGYPDERPNGYLGTGLWGQHIASWKNNGTALSSQITGINGTSFNNPSADGEPDIYYLKTPFFTVQFVFDEFGVPVFSNANGLKIIPTNFYNSSNYANSSFKVIDDQGTEYHFGTITKEQSTTTLYGTSYTFPTTWYLDKIVSFNSKDVVTLNYTTSSNNDVLNHYQTTKTYLYNGCNTTNSTPLTNTIVQPKLISSIVGSNGSVEFSYAFDRQDLVNAGRLTNIYLKSNHNSVITTLQTYGFVYSYFGSPSTNPNDLRLKLDKITIAGNTPVTTAPVDLKVFTYNTSVNLPNRSSNVFDYWGYYTLYTPINGSTDPMQYPQLRQPNLAYTKANILYAIKDISGATWELDYELNTFYNTSTSANVTVGGLRVSTLSQKLTTGENIYTTYNYNNASGNSNGQILTQSYANLVTYWPGPGVTQVASETPSNIYDINGTYIGYSSVKTINQNGGYTVSNFNNFSDFGDLINYVGGYDPNTVPNISSSTSRAFKRGALKSQIVYTASGNKISEETYSYTSLSTPVTTKAWGYHWYVSSYNVCSNSGYAALSSSFGTEIENYRANVATRKEYDQNDQTKFITSTMNYTYAANKRLLRTISTTNSKGATETKTMYYPEDMDVAGNGIPMLTGIDQTAISNLKNYNKTNVIIHENSDRNGVITQVHNTYEAFSLGSINKVFVSNVAAYKGSTLSRQQFFKYDLATSNLLSTYETNGKSTSYQYGYASAYPVAKAVNVTSSSTASFTTGTTYGGFFYLPGSSSFTTNTAGSIQLNLSFGSYPGSSNLTTANYTLTGPQNASGTLCFSMTGTGCSGLSSSVTLPNMPVGTYVLSVSVSTNTPSSNPTINWYVPNTTATYTYSKEFFYEDFEQGAANATGNAHTGKGYYTGTYSVNWTLPNARSYVMQWWSLVSGVWQFNEQAYTGPTSLTGTVDDVRIFPTDAQMTTFTYNPLIGLTGETDPSGRSLTHEYDGLSRLNITRDDDKNIIKKICYSYTGQVVGCALFANTQQSGTFTKNNCTSGTGSSVTYTVPANKYYSEISQADADQQAINEVNANGQAYANTNGTCSGQISIVVSNSRNTAFAITFTNSYNSSQVYNFSIGNYQTNYTVGQVPSGTYHVTIYPLFNTSNSYSYTVNGSYQSGVGTKYWYYVGVTCPTCGQIQIW